MLGGVFGMLELFAYLIIPISTLLMPGKSGWLESNFSVIGSRAPGQPFFVVWGIFTGIFFYLLLNRLNAQVFVLTQKHLSQLLPNSAVFLLSVSLFLPYLPESMPFLSTLHVFCAFFSSVGLFLCLAVLAHILRTCSSAYRPYFYLLGVIPPVCLILFFAADCIINSGMEIFFTIFCSLYGIRLHHRLKRELLGIQTIDQKT